MPRRCTVCLHPKRTKVDKALVANRTYRSIADEYGLSEAALKRHKKTHLPARLAKAHQAAEKTEATRLVNHRRELEAEDNREALDIIQQLRAVNAACLEVLKRARADGQDSTLLRAVDRIHRQIEIQARLLGQIQDGQTVNVLVMPEWHELRQLIIDALRPYPEARADVVRVLKLSRGAGGGTS